jgi:WD40 repeat protein
MKTLRFLVLLFILGMQALLQPAPAVSGDILYIGDNADNTIKRFDARTGEFISNTKANSDPKGVFAQSGSGGLTGSQGILVVGHDLLVVNQNVDLPIAGEILRYRLKDGAFKRKAVVPHTDPNAPFAPQGMVLGRGRRLIVANLQVQFSDDVSLPGSVFEYTFGGKFRGSLNPPAPPAGIPPENYHPRGVVFGQDGLLYVSVPTSRVTGLGGYVLRFEPDGSFVDTFIRDENATGDPGHLNRPDGLVFSPDGHLFVTSFRANANDGDSIRVYDANGLFVGKIDLDSPGGDRAFAQAILFGPGGDLFVPIAGNGPATGEVRRYSVDVAKNPVTYTYDIFVPSGGALGSGWFLTFGETDPKTLGYPTP